jgi:hypothetical protein
MYSLRGDQSEFYGLDHVKIMPGDRYRKVVV